MAVKTITPAYWKEWVVLAPGAAVARGPALKQLLWAVEETNMRLSETIAASSALMLLALRSWFPDNARDSMPFIHCSDAVITAAGTAN
jgi:hypothetical protein